MPIKKNRRDPLSKPSARTREYLRKILKAGDKLYKETDLSRQEVHIHQIRVLSKRIMILFRVSEGLKDSSDFKKVHRRSKRLRKRLGNLREIDVHIQQWREIAANEPFFQEIFDEMCKDRKYSLNQFLKKLDLEKIRKSYHKIDKEPIDEERSSFQEESFQNLVDELIEGAIQNYQGYRRSQFKDESFIHEVRIDIRYLRYALEELETLLGQGFPRLVTDLKLVQNRLGKIHDREMLFLYLNQLAKKREGRWSLGTRRGVKKVCQKIEHELKQERDEWNRHWLKTERLLLQIKKKLSISPLAERALA